MTDKTDNTYADEGPEGRVGAPQDAGYHAAPPVPPSYATAPPGAYSGGVVMDPTNGLPHGVVPAEIWQRVVARLIDAAISVALTLLLWQLLGDHFMKEVRVGSIVSYQPTPLGSGINLALSILMDLVLVALLGGQIGKLVMGIRVARDPQGATPPGWGRAALRFLVTLVAWWLCLLPGVILFLSPLWGGPRRKGWHDMAARTVVVKKPRA